MARVYRSQPEGKYDSKAEKLLLETKASIVSVCVIGGEHGNGFSLTCDLERPDMSIAIHRLPDLLRKLAAQIEDDIEKVTHQELTH